MGIIIDMLEEMVMGPRMRREKERSVQFQVLLRQEDVPSISLEELQDDDKIEKGE